MRALFRFIAFLAMTTSVIAAVVDATRSLSGDALMLTSLSAGWSNLAPGSLASVQSVMQEHLPAFLFDPVFIFVLGMPAVAVFAVLAVLFYAIGAKRERSFGKISM